MVYIGVVPSAALFVLKHLSHYTVRHDFHVLCFMFHVGLGFQFLGKCCVNIQDKYFLMLPLGII